MKKFAAMTERLRTELLAWCNASFQRQQTIQAQLAARPMWTKSLTERRANHLDALIGAPDQPDVAALFDRRLDAENALTAEAQRVLESLLPAYAAAGQIKDKDMRRAREMAIGNEGIALITPAWNRYDEAQRKYFALTNWYATGIAARQGDPLWHEKAMLYVQFMANREYNSLLTNAGVAFGLAAGRGASSAVEQRAVEEPEALENEDSPCCGGHEMPTIGLALSDTLSVSVDCKGVGVEVGTEGPIGAFVSASFQYDGRVTVFAGPRAEIGAEGLTTKVGMKDGLYITMDRNGVQDLGARVVFEVSHSVGPGISASSELDSMDFSIVSSK